MIESAPVDTDALADALRSRFAAVAGERGVTLPTSTWPILARPLGDFDRLLQAATALVANALAYAPEGGRVAVGSESVDGRWRLLVDDDGPGVPADRRDSIFERFSRLDESRSSASGGAGLGLAICARLAELMGR